VIPRRAKRRDANEPAIIDALKSISGLTIITTDAVDLIIGYKGRNYLIELKAESSISKKTGEVLESKIRPSQKTLRKEWSGQYLITASLDEILKQIGVTI
tara:strand:- start:1896 stop:2195 length:300 start_codon:yes stop_codon:yes gene_type:complete